MDARQGILQAIRSGLGSLGPAPEQIAAEAAALLSAPQRIRPKLPGKPLSEIFAERVLLPHMGATLDRVGNLSEVPDSLRRYLSEHTLSPSIAIQPTAALMHLDWSGIEIRRTAAPDEAVAVGLARWGIAETGSLVFHSGADAPTLLNFLPLHHVVALDVRNLVAHLEDYVEAGNAEPPPRNVNIITGASGTTDIEGSYVRGAHGPRFLHVILFGADT
jgi:L-lactate dehydrogenase complex protein LldG